MNRSKRGGILYKDMWQAVRNAEYVCFEPMEKHTDKEENYLKVAIQKAQSRLKQIQEEQS